MLPRKTSPGIRVLRFAASRGRHRALSWRSGCGSGVPRSPVRPGLAWERAVHDVRTPSRSCRSLLRRSTEPRGGVLLRGLAGLQAQGKLTVMSRPPSVRGIAVRVALWTRTMALTIARPSPCPLGWRSRWVPSRWNGWNKWSEVIAMAWPRVRDLDGLPGRRRQPRSMYGEPSGADRWRPGRPVMHVMRVIADPRRRQACVVNRGCHWCGRPAT